MGKAHIFGVQESAVFIQYRPESEWAAREFLVTDVPRDRDWFAANLPPMLMFWDSWKELAARADRRDLLVRKRAVAQVVTPEEAAQVLAKRPFRFLRESHDEVGEVGEGQGGAPAEEGVPLAPAVFQQAPVQVP